MSYARASSYRSTIFGSITTTQNRINLDEDIKPYFDVGEVTGSKEIRKKHAQLDGSQSGGRM
jgi:hypothetical protein